MGKSTISMAIFNSYVSLAEGMIDDDNSKIVNMNVNGKKKDKLCRLLVNYSYIMLTIILYSPYYQ